MSELKDLKYKRGQIKARLTRFTSFLDSLTSVPDSKAQVKDRMGDIICAIDDFNSIQNLIEDLDRDQFQENQLERSNFENNYYGLLSRAKNVISDHDSTPAVTSPFVDSVNNIQPQFNVKLPTLDLLKFAGNYDEWMKFQDTFNSLIHNNPSLSDVQKFYYLNSCLSGEAFSVVQSLDITSSNYTIAWNLLNERFNNKRLIVKNHIKALFNLESVAKESQTNLRHLVDTFQKHIRCLTNLGEPTMSWDTLLIHLVSSKLDFSTFRDWEKISSSQDLSKINDLIKFISEKCNFLEGLKNARNESSFKTDKIKSNVRSNNKSSVAFLSNNTLNCVFCNKTHLIYNCPDFLKLAPSSRYTESKLLRLCLNCLRKNHSTNNCSSVGCKQCNKKHNTLLHFSNTHEQAPIINSNNKNTSSDIVQTHNVNINAPSTSISNHALFNTNVLLSTATIKVLDRKGNIVECKALLDNGSQSNFITNELCNKLKLSKKDVSISVSGVGSGALKLSSFTNLTFYARSGNYHSEIDCLVLPKITDCVPAISFSSELLNVPKNLLLADPTYYKSSNIDLLLGAGIFWELLCIGQISTGKNKPVLQKTQLGWIVSGPIHFSKQNQVKCNLSQSLESQISKFWELEEVNYNTKHLTPDEQYCESLFSSTTERDISGRFVVRLPLKSNIDNLGNSKQGALKRFYSLERKLAQKESLKVQYQNFLHDYQSLGHMSKLNETYCNNSNEFYLPHHAICKESSLTTKLRVVFDGSAPTSTGLSLNDCQMVGPVLQDDLFSLLVRFRKHPIVLGADISKMYRQIMVHEEDRRFQKIFWRNTSESRLETYTLNTATYGTAAASYLAIRCLQQTAHEHIIEFPIASSIILGDFYVDDLLTGANSVEEAIQLQSDITNILKTGGFELRKWFSNSSDVIKNIPDAAKPFVLSFSESKDFKTLGLQWNALNDQLQYVIKDCSHTNVTKRSIISKLAQIFDPLGLLGPVIIVAKIIIQKLWQDKFDWDESIPCYLYNMWIQFHKSLNHLNSLKIARFACISNPISVELNGFSDASEKAYGACIYITSTYDNNKAICNLLCAKSRVAPLKSTTIPRLELCGALLLAKLMQKVKTALQLHIHKTTYYCDSTIVLSWLKSASNQFNIFVANRIAEIQDLTDVTSWRHVSTNDNPADLLSRGTDSSNFLDNSLWWHGPTWLVDNDFVIQDDYEPLSVNTLPEARKSTICNLISHDYNIFERYDSFLKLQRVFTYCRRFINNCKHKAENRKTGILTVKELNESTSALIKYVQNSHFVQEIDDLQKNNTLNSKSSIISLNPFLDSDNILRVGGRLRNSSFEYDKRHPILLPAKHVLTELIIKHYHINLLHAGPQLLLANVRETYWPVNGKSTAKRIVRQCTHCFRAKPGKPVNPIMGNLPETRLTPARPFLNCGIDYAGPFMIKDKKARGFKLIKAYVCVFVCFSTKAIHIELVSDLTAESFLAALRRFVSRRGICSNIYSDNGGNFVKANSELQDFFQNNEKVIMSKLANEKINWHFSPPRSPHFGGLWEAGVKSIKYHLHRVLGNAHLTFEELYTVLTQIEACLNSRPLTPLSNDPNDFNALTPAHFLIGESLKCVPDPNLLHLKENTLSSFQRCQQLKQHFWQRWSLEYIATLQQRTKWKQETPAIAPGTMVLLREDNLHPLNWKLGRITSTHPGKDGVVRTVSVKAASGEYKRAVHKLAILPIDNH